VLLRPRNQHTLCIKLVYQLSGDPRALLHRSQELVTAYLARMRRRSPRFRSMDREWLLVRL